MTPSVLLEECVADCRDAILTRQDSLRESWSPAYTEEALLFLISGRLKAIQRLLLTHRLTEKEPEDVR